ncbi:MAG: hypothetical protein D6682_01360 [Zetaproteobacteria bacterium]|nr:MAG: hypothetical protein D6682_01360 [Zetaproteobacteria bacterium]
MVGGGVALFGPLASALADPLDQGEGYATRGVAPSMLDRGDVALLLVDYGVFALAVVALGWVALRRPGLLLRLEQYLRAPFAAIFAAAGRAGGVAGIVLHLIGVMVVLLALAVWIFACQWLKHAGLGALSMVGLALLALVLVRAIRQGGAEPRMP